MSGKTNTKYAWDTPMPDGAEPKIWFHDIFHPDGSPYSQAEIDLIKSLTGVRPPEQIGDGLPGKSLFPLIPERYPAPL